MMRSADPAGDDGSDDVDTGDAAETDAGDADAEEAPTATAEPTATPAPAPAARLPTEIVEATGGDGVAQPLFNAALPEGWTEDRMPLRWRGRRLHRRR